MPDPNEARALFLDLLRCAVRGESFGEPLRRDAAAGLYRLSRSHSVLPLIVEAGGAALRSLLPRARSLTIAQAQRTADFLLFYAFLNARGLYPAVIKGVVVRSLYPHPEQRASVDEDLVIRPEEFPVCHQAMLDYGLSVVDQGKDIDESGEASYEDKERGLYVEVHMSAFALDSDAYRDLNTLFDGMLERCTTVTVYGQQLVTLAPTDHLLYLLCHAYKHFLHGGFGIRQICDIGIFAERYDAQIDWASLRQRCESVRIERFSAAVFQIAARHLGFSMPKVFSDIDVDEKDLLEDVLSGGLYGVNDINRVHSSTITLDAVAKQKQGRRRGGALASVFLPLQSMKVKFPYLNQYPWLLPFAWGQRVGQYLLRRDSKVDPGASVRIGSERVRLLKEYGIID